VASARITSKQTRLRRWGIHEKNKYVPYVEYWKYAFDHGIISKNDPELWNVFLWAIYHAYETYLPNPENPYKALVFFFIDEKFEYDRNLHSLLLYDISSFTTLLLLSYRSSVEEFKNILLYCDSEQLIRPNLVSTLSGVLVYTPNFEIKQCIIDLLHVNAPLATYVELFNSMTDMSQNLFNTLREAYSCDVKAPYVGQS
jgi:hypothetical protein